MEIQEIMNRFYTLCAAIACTTSIASAEDKPTQAPSAKDATLDIEAYIQEKSSMFSINKRDKDPFGQPQDPHKKVVAKTAPTRRSAP